MSLSRCANPGHDFSRRETTAAGGGRTDGTVVGGLIGAAAGALIADATRPGYCDYYRNHRRHYRRY